MIVFDAPTSRLNASSFSSTSVSSRVMLFTLTSPVFVTTTVYVTTVPTSAFSLGSASFVMLSSALVSPIVTVASSSSLISLPFGSVPVAVTVLST